MVTTRTGTVLVLGISVALGCVASNGNEDDGAADGEGEAEGAESGEEEGGGSGGTPDMSCVSGLRWASGDAESPLMHPGTDCIACHQQRGEAEEVRLAGTVYTEYTEADDCYGVAGVTIVLTGADGVVVQMTTNDAGNFMREQTIATPYTAKIVYEGRERAMATPQTVFSCNSCHGAVGVNAAPGRIIAP
jgi:hypothetical protein